MKKISLLGICLLAFLANVSSQTVDEILNSFEAASGGRDKLEAVKTIQVESNMKMSMMGQDMDISLSSIKEKGKLYRREMGGIMGMGKSWTLITDTAGYALTPSMPGFGGRGGGGGFGGGGGGGDRPQPSGPTINKLSDEDVKSQQFELDCAGSFGLLVNYAAKGSKAELLGTEKINKQECFKIKLTLASGQFANYFISSKNYTVIQVDATGPMAANMSGFGNFMKMLGNEGRIRNMKVSIGYSNYKEFGGIQYPTKEVINLGPVDILIENKDVRVNEEVDPVWYKAK